MQFQKRQTAYKFWIKDAISARPVIVDNFVDHFIVRGKQVSRASIIASVVFKFESEDGNYAAVTLDDGTETIRLKCWREDTPMLKELKISDIILAVGRFKEYNNELYINPEIIKIVEPNWELLRKVELLKEHGKPCEVENVPEMQARQRVLDTIERFSSDEGAGLNIIIKNSGLSEDKVNETVKGLLKEGEIFENQPGKLKVT